MSVKCKEHPNVELVDVRETVDRIVQRCVICDMDKDLTPKE